MSAGDAGGATVVGRVRNPGASVSVGSARGAGSAGSASSAFESVLDELGSAIVSGALPPGHTEPVEAIVERLGVSRSIVREAVRVLVDGGLVRAAQRVGIRVLPPDAWDVLDPRVIRWRLASPAAPVQIEELRQLRLAVEPEAAALAAAHRPADAGRELIMLAGELAVAHTSEEFFLADRRFHALILSSSGNAMFVRLQSVIEEALRERARRGADTFPADAAALELHARIARAIEGRRPAQARAASRALVEGG